MRSTRVALVVAATTVIAACAPATNGAGPSSRNIITSEDMVQTNAQTVYDAVRVLQPHWLGSRGPTSITDRSPTRVSVFINGVEVGDASYLRNLRIVDVAALRYYEPGDAATRFGMGHQRGVIEVTLKGGS